MQEKFVSNFSQYGKTAIDSTRELVAINGRLISKVLENQIKFANICMESSAKEIEAVSGSKDPKAFLASQTALVEQYTAMMKEQAQTSAKVFQEAGEEIKTWFEKGIKTADAAVKEAAKEAKVAPLVAPVAPKPAAKKAPVKKAAPKTAAAKKPATKKPAPKKAAPKKAEA